MPTESFLKLHKSPALPTAAIQPVHHPSPGTKFTSSLPKYLKGTHIRRSPALSHQSINNGFRVSGPADPWQWTPAYCETLSSQPLSRFQMCLQLEPKVRAFAACWSHETLLFTHFLGARDFLWPGVFSTHGVMECHSSISTGSLWRLPTVLSPHLAHARSSVPEFLLGPMQLWAGDHLAEILYSTQPKDVLRFLP